MSKNLRTEAVDHLFDAILCLKDKEECYTFFEDVCTVNELLSLSQRFEVAKMLREQKTYLDIAEKTGASTATISRVNRSLNYGNDGYEMVFSRLSQKHPEQEQKKGTDAYLHLCLKIQSSVWIKRCLFWRIPFWNSLFYLFQENHFLINITSKICKFQIK